MAAGGDHGNSRHEAALRRDRVLQLRDEGLTFPEIGAELRITYQRAWQIHRQALRERPALAAAAIRDEERKQAQLAVIDEQRRDIDMEREAVMEILGRDGRTVVTASGKVIENVQDDPTALSAIDRLIRLDELLIKLADQEAKLLSLYPKIDVSHSGAVTYEVIHTPREQP